MKAIGEFLYKYRHAALLLYFFPYMMWFGWLQQNTRPVVWVCSWIDGYIPFLEIFVIPYLIWFFYIAAAMAYFLFQSRTEFLKLCTFLFTGMTICLLIYTILPNGQFLRPLVFKRHNIFTDLVRTIYLLDPSFNVCPSIHCLNSIGVHIAIRRSQLGQRSRAIRYGSGVLMVLICLSTVFIKQHSIIDVVAAIILSIPLYLLAYRFDQIRDYFVQRRARRLSRDPA